MSQSAGSFIKTPFQRTLIGWRIKRGYTQNEASELLDVGLRTYKAWEGGETLPNVRIVLLALAALEDGLQEFELR